AGEGLRCRPLTLTRSKVMLPVANKPIIEHVINACRENNIKDIILVVGYKKEKIMDYFKNGIDFGVNITYVHQKKALGTAHAIKHAEKLIDNEFIVLNGDNLVDENAISDLLKNKSGDVSILTTIREKACGYGVVVKENDKLKIIEKPLHEISRMINTGMYVFSQVVFSEIKDTPISNKGDYAITDTIQQMIQRGYNVKAIPTDATWMDAVYSWNLLNINSILLEKCKEMDIKGLIEKNVVLKGKVIIGEDTIIHSGCYIAGPVIIGKNCEIGPNVTLLPCTTIGNNVTLHSFIEVSNSIIMNDVRLGSHSSISNSVIGCNNNIGDHFIVETKKDLYIEMYGLLHHADEIGTVIGDGNEIGSNVLIRAGKMIETNCKIESGNIINTTLPSNSIVI
ncbi:MAG: bifunctional sugar-1-phosphate nucleotidylyltransferase/acetyltransferase, partial [Methanosarcinales archaeon]